MSEFNQITILSRSLLTNKWLNVSDIKEGLNLNQELFDTILVDLNEKSKDLGINLELIELNGIEYLLYLVENDEPQLTNNELAILGIFAWMTKEHGGTLLTEQINEFFNSKIQIINNLLEKNYLIKTELMWQISPLGAIYVYPLFEKETNFTYLVNKILKKG